MEVHKLCIFMATLIGLISLATGQTVYPRNCTITGSTETTCPANTTKCFIRTDTSGGVTRGCVTDDTCVAPSCISCETELCNSYPMCRHCDGSQAACATSTANETSFNELCTSATQVCLNQVNANGTVTRGCSNTECESAAGANCSSCKGDNCNAGIFPTDRRQCYQCTGEACNTVTDAMLQPCAIYEQDKQKCYTIGSDAKTMERGCTTDTSTKCAIDTTDSSCSLCNDANGCNNRPYSNVLGSCIKCSNADTCIAAQDASKAVACAESNYTQSINQCYYQIASNGTVHRGCVNELPAGETCESKDNCETCNGSACNIAAGVFTCLTCRSDNYPPCRQAHVGGEPCLNTTLTSDDSMKCYNGEWDGIVVRGCYIDLNSLQKYQCDDNSDNRCKVHTGVNSNTDVYNGAHSRVLHLGLLLLGLIFVMGQLH